jgi:hypothetical protein
VTVLERSICSYFFGQRLVVKVADTRPVGRRPTTRYANLSASERIGGTIAAFARRRAGHPNAQTNPFPPRALSGIKRTQRSRRSLKDQILHEAYRIESRLQDYAAVTLWVRIFTPAFTVVHVGLLG